MPRLTPRRTPRGGGFARPSKFPVHKTTDLQSRFPSGMFHRGCFKTQAPNFNTEGILLLPCARPPSKGVVNAPQACQRTPKALKHWSSDVKLPMRLSRNPFFERRFDKIVGRPRGLKLGLQPSRLSSAFLNFVLQSVTIHSNPS
ncbi:hypothetical protein RRG08_014441 [Elysia crispata]|uniref:Uncharacterized protein n=1 Tax=Elysia crispata TaxID=231223 RepID=A0AAE1CJC3_9GAST|nr:hypothetical protein RRG08_014441 [Elysia crispata]